MTNRKLAALQTKKKIVDATKKLMSEKSFKDISIEDITNEAGVAIGSFYTYFKKKEAIIEEMADSDFYHLDEVVSKLKDKKIEDKLNYYCKKFLSVIETNGIEMCRQWTKNNLSPKMMFINPETTKYNHDFEVVKKILNDAVKNKELKKDTPVKDLALFINSQLYGLMISWCMSDGKIVGSNQIDKYSKLIIAKVIEAYKS